MTSAERLRIRAETCARKVAHKTWESARIAALEAWGHPRPKDLNPGLPYLCDIGGTVHYHHGHRQTLP